MAGHLLAQERRAQLEHVEQAEGVEGGDQRGEILFGGLPVGGGCAGVFEDARVGEEGGDRSLAQRAAVDGGEVFAVGEYVLRGFRC